MVVMSSNFDQRGKDHGVSNPGSRKADGKNFGPYNQGKGQNQVILQNPSQGPGQPVSTGMPETFVSGFYPNANSAFPMSFQNFNQAPWSTGTNTQQGFDPPNFGFGGVTQVNPVNSINPVNAAPGGGTENQPYLTDHLFTQNSSGFQNPYSGPFMNGTGISSWSYFNNPSSFFFPTGNADLNLTWGPENPNPSQLFQDLYKPPPPPEHEKARAESGDLAAFANGDIKTEDVGKALSHLNVSVNDQDTNEENEEGGASSAGSAGKSSENSGGQSGSSNAPKLVSWASVAKQPAKPKPPSSKGHAKAPVQLPSSNKGNYSNQNGTVSVKGGPAKGQQGGSGGRWVRQGGGNEASGVPDASSVSKDSSPLLQKLCAKNTFNPKEFSLNLKNARTFIIKSYSEDDIFRSIKYSIWTSTEHGNRKLSEAFKEQKGNPVYLLYSVNGSGHFCGVALMMSEVDLDVETGVWVQDKWKGRFDVKWVYVKDVPNSTLRHIRLENNENKPVTNSRDTQEVPHDKAKQVLKIIHSFKAQTSIFDDFSHYEKRQEDDFQFRGKPMLEVDI